MTRSNAGPLSYAKRRAARMEGALGAVVLAAVAGLFAPDGARPWIFGFVLLCAVVGLYDDEAAGAEVGRQRARRDDDAHGAEDRQDSK